MSFNRRKNIYTLGDFHQQYPVKALSRRQNSDPFERDPFKIQSYNFHYAERPSFPLSNIGNRVSSQTTVKRFETFYYNYDFAPTRNDKENNSTNKFHEFRRRKFLNDHQQVTPIQYQHFGQYQHSHPNTQQLLSQSPRPGMLRPTTYGGLLGSGGTNNISSAIPTLPQAGASREHLPGLRALHAANASAAATSAFSQQQLQQQRQRQRQLQQQSSRTNVATSVDLIGCDSKTSLAGNGSAGGMRRHFSEAHTNTSNSSVPDKVQSSSPRLSASQHNRRPLQTLHVSAENVVSGRVAASASNHQIGPKRSTCSGCQININIKGLDDTQLGENLTIKIESDQTSSKHKLNQLQDNLQQKQKQQQKEEQREQREQRHQQHSSNNLTPLFGSSENLRKPLNITNNDSSNTFIIDKHLSKTSLRGNRTESPQREKRSEPKLKEFKPLPPFVVPHRKSKERMPSIVPWNFDENLRSCFAKETLTPYTGIRELHLSETRPTNQMRRVRTNYNCALNDLKNLHNYEKLIRARSSGLPAAGLPTSPGKSQPMKGEHKLLNTQSSRKSDLMMAHKCEPIKLSMPTSSDKCHESASRLSLRSSGEKCTNFFKKNSFTPCRSSETEFGNRRSNSLIYQSRHNLSPLNVNINVYADKLKLLRV